MGEKVQLFLTKNASSYRCRRNGNERHLEDVTIITASGKMHQETIVR